MAARRRPGANIADAERHTVKRTLRLTPAESAALDSVAEARGVNVSRTVGEMAREYATRADRLDEWYANNAPPPVRPNARKK